MTIPTMRIHFGWCSKAAALALFLLGSATAGPLKLQCPASYPAGQQLLDLRAKGWRAAAASERGLLLTEAGVLTGSPEDNGELRGSDLPRGSGRQFNFYGTSKDGEKWLYCRYGSHGQRLTYPLAVKIRRCETSEQMARERLVVASIRCE
jgi:hypothetical protein